MKKIENTINKLTNSIIFEEPPESAYRKEYYFGVKDFRNNFGVAYPCQIATPNTNDSEMTLSMEDAFKAVNCNKSPIYNEQLNHPLMFYFVIVFNLTAVYEVKLSFNKESLFARNLNRSQTASASLALEFKEEYTYEKLKDKPFREEVEISCVVKQRGRKNPFVKKFKFIFTN